MDRHTGKGLGLALGVGVGLGLLAGTVLMAITQQPKELSREQIIQKARALGMISVSEMPAPAPPAASQSKADSAQPPATPPAQAPAAAPAQSPAAGTEPAPATPNAAGVTVSIEDGATFSQVAEQLQEAGLIQDADAFTARARETGAVTRLRVGTHHIVLGTGAEEILTILTSLNPER